MKYIEVLGAKENNLKDLNLKIPRGEFIVFTGVSGSGKSSLVFDTILAESQRRFFYTLSNYTRQFLDIQDRPKVKKVLGISPAIFLGQNETSPSSRASVGTVSDIGELLGILFNRFATRSCPDHQIETTGSTLESIAREIRSRKSPSSYLFVAPIVTDKKGKYAKELKKFQDIGYSRFYIDGELVQSEESIELSSSHKHTIKLVVDLVHSQKTSLQRIKRAIDTCMKYGDGKCEAVPMIKKEYDFDQAEVFSLESGCPRCGFSWPTLDSRYFSANSQGRCDECDGYGYFDTSSEDSPSRGDLAFQKEFWEPCEECNGTGLRSDLKNIHFNSIHLLDLYKTSINELKKSIKDIKINRKNDAFLLVKKEIIEKIEQLQMIGLGYLSLSRRIRTISGGELQRLRLASLLQSNLSGILYIFDEPSQGLHPTEVQTITEILTTLKNKGNSILVIDHDEVMMDSADLIIDLGPGGGPQGGKIVSRFKPRTLKAQLKTSKSAQALHRFQQSKELILKPIHKLKKSTSSPSLLKSKDYLHLIDPQLHNLQMKSASFRLHSLNVVSGVSGSGKSSLVKGVLYQALLAQTGKIKRPLLFCKKLLNDDGIRHVHLLDRKPISKSRVSIPATFLDIFSDIRTLFSKTSNAQILGLTHKNFSFNSKGGRCETCGGRGYISMSMKFLPDSRSNCYQCNGKRYDPIVLSVVYKEYNIAEVLDLSIGEALEVFKNHRKIADKLQVAFDLGLHYLKIGQPTATLSGGEAQRLKLVPIIAKKKPAVILLDEPTMGLHSENIDQLCLAIEKLTAKNFTFILIDNAPQLLEYAKWHILVGPGSADLGGRLISQSTPR